MYEKMNSPQCIQNKVKFAPPDYSKENYLAIFAPQRDLTPKQIFGAKDETDRKKVEASVLKPLSTPTVYLPNTPVKLVPRVLPTKSQVKINLYTVTKLFTEFDKTFKKRITPTGLTERERGFEQTKRCYLTEVMLFFKTLKQHFEGVQKALFKEVKGMEEIFDQMSAEVDQNTMDKQHAEIEVIPFFKTLKQHFEGVLLLKQYDEESFNSSRTSWKSSSDSKISGIDHFGLSWVMEIMLLKAFLLCCDMNGVDLLKASKIKSWLWHHRLNHLNFGTINDLAQKKLVRGLPRLKFEKDHLCLACQLGKKVHASNYVLPMDKDLELLFQPMFDEYFEVTRVDAPVPSAIAVNAHVVPPGTSVTTTFAQDALSTSFSPSSSRIQPPVIQHDVVIGPTNEDTPITQATFPPSNNLVTGEPGSAQSSSGDVSIAEL
ncbi:integrase, catalytic region, zinc finger, CCHC-type containing protein [Tanacetum coccineum]